MRRAKLEERKRFAAEVARRDAAAGSVSQDRTPGRQMLLQARASVARRLVRDGVVDGPLALSYTVWPTRAVLNRERLVGYGTLAGRAFGRRGNP